MRRNIPAVTRIARRLLLTGSTPPAPSWSPLILPGLVYWWDASTSSGSGDGGAVTTWTDRKSSVAATQATGSAQPVYRDNGGKPSLLFDGSDDVLATPASLTLAQSFTALAIARRAVTGGFRNLWASDTTVFLRSQNAAPLMFAGAVLQDGTRGITTGQWFCLVGTFAGAASSLRFCAAPTSGNCGMVGIGPTGALKLGGAYAADGGTNWSGDLAHLVFCSGTVPAADIAQFEAWAASQYGITLL